MSVKKFLIFAAFLGGLGILANKLKICLSMSLDGLFSFCHFLFGKKKVANVNA